jgi:hypothetical protein
LRSIDDPVWDKFKFATPCRRPIVELLGAGDRSITGHSMTTVQEVLDAHYLGGRVELAEPAIKKLSEVYAQRQK